MTRISLQKLLQVQCGPVARAKLLTFPDTGRCKGQAYVTFQTEESAKKALSLSGTVLEDDGDDDQNNKKGKRKQEKVKKPHKELKLKVTKVLSRVATKEKKEVVAQPVKKWLHGLGSLN